MNKIFSAVLLLALLLAACAPAQTPTAVVPPTAAAQPAAPKLDLQGCKPATLTDKPITLRFLRQQYGDVQEAYYADVYKQWNAAYPNIKIQEEQVPFGQLFTKVITDGASGNPPDIMMGQGDFTRNYVYNKMVLPLNDYLTEEFMNDYVAPLKDMATVDGKLYLFPYDLQASVMAWNKDIFEKAGVAEPPQTTDSSNAWTWEQWRDAMRKIQAYLDKTGGGTVWALTPSGFGGGGPGSNYWHEGQLIRSYGDPNAPKDSTAYKTWAGISEDGLTATGYVDTPEAIESMKMYQSFFTEKLTPTGVVQNSWGDQKSVVSWEGSGIWTFIPALNIKFKPNVGPTPIGKVQFTHISGDSQIVSSKTKYPAEATAFLCFLTNDTNRIGWDKVWGSIPPRKSLVAKLPQYKEWPFNMFMDTVTKFGAAAPKTAGTFEYENAMNQAIKDIALGADPATRLHEAAKQIDGLLAKYKE